MNSQGNRDGVKSVPRLDLNNLGPWIKRSMHLEIRDKAFIRFLHANGVDAPDITKQSTWHLEAVNRAIIDDYENSTATTGADVADHVCPEFYARLEKIKPGAVARESDANLSWDALCAKYNVRDSVEDTKSSVIDPEKHDSDRKSSHTCTDHDGRSGTGTPVGDLLSFGHNEMKDQKKAHHAAGPIRTGSTSDVAYHPYRQVAHSGRHIATDAFLQKLFEGVPVDAVWYEVFRNEGYNEAKLRHLAELLPTADAADSFFEKKFPGMLSVDRFLLGAAFIKLCSPDDL
ncbi:hypothetical protein C8J57DRAFT_1706482 [Mycena rebaudengoi]|nr:hypothetical protein C8J57DRAFT_1706482 [Mycena rebaudengoi]